MLEVDLEGAFYEALQVGNASQAEEILTRASIQASDTNQTIAVSQLIFTLASHYFEYGNKVAALKWYEKLVADYGKQLADEENNITYETLVAERVTWLRNGGKRDWASPDPLDLSNKIFDALMKSETQTLDKLLAKIDTYVGWWESEYEHTPRQVLLEHIQKYRTASLTWDNSEELKTAVKNGEKVLYINTHGWQTMESFKNIQFALHSIAEGWEWRGIVLGESK